MDQLILVDSKDNEIGYASADECHSGAFKRHRALSVFVFNDAGEMLITQRSRKKKTWPLFWSNACCSHPRKGQDCQEAARKRQDDELGFDAPVVLLFKFEYSARYDASWGEHELDWVFASHCNGPFQPNADEINDWKFISIDDLKMQMRSEPATFTPWFHICLDRVVELRP
jgi:isopentenyl-diphosphate Delta-isomerase